MSKIYNASEDDSKKTKECERKITFLNVFKCVNSNLSLEPFIHDAVKVLHTTCQQIWKTQQWPQGWKRSVFIPVPKKSNAKEYSNYRTVALISYARKVMFKILQDRLKQYVNPELPDVQAGFRKGRGTRDQIANIRWKKQGSFRKRLTSASLNMAKPSTVWITINCGKF